MKFILHYKFSIAVAAVIFYISILKSAQLPSGIHLFAGADKLAHLLMYLGLGLMLNFETKQRALNNKWLILFVFPILYGGIIELLQENFFPPRSGEWLDFAANTTGVILAYFIYRKYLRKYYC